MKKTTIIHLLLIAALFSVTAPVKSQSQVLLHSHNDYTRTMPFYEAYSQHCSSIECDMYYTDGKFLVGHDPEDLRPDITFERLYLTPLLNIYSLNGGRPYAGSEALIQLVVEIKSKNTAEYMTALVKILEEHPDIFNPSINPYACRIMVTGRVPQPEDFTKYPSYVTFDGDLKTDYTPGQLEQIAMYSFCFSTYSKWNGTGTLDPAEKQTVDSLIARSHAKGKPVRFWGAPDNTAAWETFASMGIDYINTDQPAKCAIHFGK